MALEVSSILTVATMRPEDGLGKFRCMKCKKEFRIKPGSHSESHCSFCGSIYYKWLDYEDWELY